MIPDILQKLKRELTAGITTEVQVVYLLAAIRKILEQEGTAQQYKYLNFHCNWALHSSMDRRDAQEVLRLFDSVHAHFCSGSPEDDLSADIKRDLQRISRMYSFAEEMDAFLQGKGLPGLATQRPDGWVYFLHLYTKVIEDCPLVLRNEDAMSVQKVTVNIEFANQTVGGELCFRVIWTVIDSAGKSGSHAVYNSFSLTESQ